MFRFLSQQRPDQVLQIAGAAAFATAAVCGVLTETGPQNGVNTMQVGDVDGVRLQGLLFDAGTVNSAALLTVGTAGSTVSHASNPISVQDVFFRIGGDIAGKASASLVVNADDTIVDDIWAWRADHGNSGTVGWTTNTAGNGLTVNGNNVEATGLFVEHYQQTEVAWNGQNGKIIFFQNEMPYDPPNQAAWMNGSSNGYRAIVVASKVTSFGAWALGSYCYFNVNPGRQLGQRVPVAFHRRRGLARSAHCLGAEAHLPFGGNGESGNGSRQLRMWVLDQFTRWQSMNSDYSGRLQKAQIDVTELTPDESFRLPD